MISEITAEAEIGQTYTGKVVRLEEYGAFIEILPNVVGLLHISEVAPYRIKSIRDVIRLGDTLTVKVISIDEDNKIRLSKKALEETSPRPEDSRPPQKRNFRDRPFSDRRGQKNRF
jgi:polyribonucleotide nucleotidyltransferase